MTGRRQRFAGAALTLLFLSGASAARAQTQYPPGPTTTTAPATVPPPVFSPTTTTTSTTTTTTTTTAPPPVATTPAAVVTTTTSRATTTTACTQLSVIVGGWRPNTTVTITVNGQTFTAKADADGMLNTTITVCAINDGDSVSASGISFSGQRRTVVLGIQGGTATEAAPSGGVGAVAFTGSSATLPLTFAGFAIIGAGVVLVGASRKRRRATVRR